MPLSAPRWHTLQPVLLGFSCPTLLSSDSPTGADPDSFEALDLVSYFLFSIFLSRSSLATFLSPATRPLLFVSCYLLTVRAFIPI